MTLLFALWLQAATDVRSVSWWLPHNPALRGVIWWAVFTLNLLVLVWFLYKMLFKGAPMNLPAALRQRGQSIQEQIREAEQAHRDAETRLRDTEARIANLPAEIQALALEAEREAEEEYKRLVEESERDAERILRQGRLEIEAAARLAQKELQRLAASLAVDLATQRLRERLTPEQDETVVGAGLASLTAGRPQ